MTKRPRAPRTPQDPSKLSRELLHVFFFFLYEAASRSVLKISSSVLSPGSSTPGVGVELPIFFEGGWPLLFCIEEEEDNQIFFLI